MSRVHWLLDIDVDGHVHRLSDTAVDVQRDDGTWLHYSGDVEVQPVTESLSMLSPSVTQPEAQVRVYLDGVSALDILRARGELARWVEGTTYERRRRVLVGACQSPEMASAAEGISTTIAQDAWADPATMIASSEAVSSTTWATAGATVVDHEAIAYPIIIGHPGRRSTGWCSALVALRVDATLGVALAPDYTGVALQLANHHISATRVRLSTETDVAGIIAHVINTFDDLGQPVAVCPWFWSTTAVPPVLAYSGAETYAFTGGSGEYGLGASTIAPAYNDDGDQPAIYAALEDATDPSSGGLVVNGRLLRAAGDVAAWALAQSGALLDEARMVEAYEALNVYPIDTVIADRESSRPWEWVVRVLLPILPCSMASGPDGLYLVPLLLDATEGDAEARLDTSRADVAVVGGIRWDTSRLVRSVTVCYDYDVRRARYLSRAIRGSASAAAADSSGRTEAHPALTLAEQWGLRGEDLVIETGAFYGAEGAELCASTLARIRGLPTALITFGVSESDPLFFRLRRGSLVYCVDALVAGEGLNPLGTVVEIETGGDGSLLVTAWLRVAGA